MPKTASKKKVSTKTATKRRRASVDDVSKEQMQAIQATEAEDLRPDEFPDNAYESEGWVTEEEDEYDEEDEEMGGPTTTTTTTTDGVKLQGANSDKLVMNPKAYDMHHTLRSGWSCISFDCVIDSSGFNRKKAPVECFLIGGRQGENRATCSLDLMHAKKLMRTYNDEGSDDEDEEEEEEEEEDDDGEPAVLFNKEFQHYDTPNRVKVNRLKTDQKIVAVWSAAGVLEAYNVTDLYEQLADPTGWIKKQAEGKLVLPPSGKQDLKPFFKSTRAQHSTEGYAIAWSLHREGWLASADCGGNLITWDMAEINVNTQHVSGCNRVGQHKGSIEDIQWSPQQEQILATCGVDGTVRIWDLRTENKDKCKLTWKADNYDINVIAWNTHSGYQGMMATGSDTGGFAIWDLRHLTKATDEATPIAAHHFHTEPITAIEWSPISDSVLLVGDYKEVGLWEFSAEKDTEEQEHTTANGRVIPPQLLFLHEGHDELRDAHWHPQVPGLLISTDSQGIQFWRPHKWQKMVC